jgi:hypothetical protein
VGSGGAEAVPSSSLLLLKLVSRGIELRCFFPATSSSLPSLVSILLLRVVVSTGSGANRRTFLAVSSTGMAWNRLVGGGDVSGMLRWEENQLSRVMPRTPDLWVI